MVEEGAEGLAPPVPTQLTVTPLTGLAPASVTRTLSGVASVAPIVSVWALPAFKAIAVAAPAVPVAVKVTGLPLSPVEVAVRVLLPALGPRVQDVTWAMPLPFVAIGVVGFTVPPPTVTAKVTFVPFTGLLN